MSQLQSNKSSTAGYAVGPDGFMLAKLKIDALNPNDRDCSLCAESYDTSAHAPIGLVFRCRHHFCKKCIKRWVKKEGKNTCPNCRQLVWPDLRVSIHGYRLADVDNRSGVFAVGNAPEPQRMLPPVPTWAAQSTIIPQRPPAVPYTRFHYDAGFNVHTVWGNLLNYPDVESITRRAAYLVWGNGINGLPVQMLQAFVTVARDWIQSCLRINASTPTWCMVTLRESLVGQLNHLLDREVGQTGTWHINHRGVTANWARADVNGLHKSYVAAVMQLLRGGSVVDVDGNTY